MVKCGVSCFLTHGVVFDVLPSAEDSSALTDEPRVVWSAACNPVSDAIQLASGR